MVTRGNHPDQRAHRNGLAQQGSLLAAVDDAGAGVGFLPPLPREEATAYWRGVRLEPNRLLLARQGERIDGAAPVQPAARANGRRRADLATRLMDPPL